MTAALSIGIAAAAGAEVGARVAAAAEAAGLHALWVNDTPGHDALAVLAAAAGATERLVLATGVLPIDRRTPDDILARAAGLPADRLVLGIGSGQLRHGAVDRVTDAATALRAGTEARVVVGALGPRMRRTGAEASDGLLLSWLTPEIAADQARHAHELARTAHVALYVRTAVDPDAIPALDEEAQRYAGYPAYAANFARLGVQAAETVIRPAALRDRIAAYRAAADEVVLRAITASGSLDEHLRFIDAVAEAVA
ncbi:alkanesulfonate monooxygenase SsuD/methylene tetrahydromethanopterin reductase-like flavin-dependent oxidoreductase (luciferase family) [Microbacterium trichothecenolyticum]|uniref:LLM class flavin-dependent oxidoreductase n=1 Tax=Microbacterium trichothecenolyticum TaxID=69370 RepID=UPI00285B0565|nr:LLM class flavin-dependent oxidoreductase [Microbacterium trichothecenolyticum]MDR7111519.1 alkanesulfonate monooxygenase SsuD/methylene tetrahydromethanopterin reductase-like flavin-dependent oxidoreductase (luciferase family) [Microbacterium trichothecenolyticum]